MISIQRRYVDALQRRYVDAIQRRYVDAIQRRYVDAIQRRYVATIIVKRIDPFGTHLFALQRLINISVVVMGQSLRYKTDKAGIRF